MKSSVFSGSNFQPETSEFQCLRSTSWKLPRRRQVFWQDQSKPNRTWNGTLPVDVGYANRLELSSKSVLMLDHIGIDICGLIHCARANLCLQAMKHHKFHYCNKWIITSYILHTIPTQNRPPNEGTSLLTPHFTARCWFSRNVSLYAFHLFLRANYISTP